MADVILAVLGRPKTANAVLNAAQGLAALIGRASIVVLAVDAPPAANPLAAEALMAEVADVAAARGRNRRRTASLRASFDAWVSDARQAGIAAQWNEVDGAENVVVEQQGRRADFVVIARPTPDDDGSTRREFQAALFHTERPVLVVPDGAPARFGHRVAIAWRDDSRTVKAVMPALRVLGGAAQVDLLAGVRERAPVPSIPSVLHDHGINASLHVLPIGPDPFGKTLLDKVHRIGADMLVMGAYAHSPLREMIFGGVTSYMLEHADVPLLMRH